MDKKRKTELVLTSKEFWIEVGRGLLAVGMIVPFCLGLYLLPEIVRYFDK